MNRFSVLAKRVLKQYPDADKTWLYHQVNRLLHIQ